MQRAISFGLTNILAAAVAAGFSASFQSALKFTIPQEGTYFEIVAGDNGGATCCGVTQECYDAYRHAHILPSRSVEFITSREVAALYHEQDWTAMHGDAIDPHSALAAFDTSVNSGKSEATILMQRVLGIKDDGVFGPVTLAAAQHYIGVHGGQQLGLGIVARRKALDTEIAAEHPHDQQFLADWLRRCDDLAKAVSA